MKIHKEWRANVLITHERKRIRFRSPRVLTLLGWVSLATALAYGFANSGETSEQSLRECIEYQLFFKTVEVPPDASAEDYKEQKDGFDALGLSERDAKVLAEAVSVFRDQYSQLQENFEKASKHDTVSAIASSKQVDALVDATDADLKKNLSPKGLKAIANVINGDEELKRRADQYVRWRGLREMQAKNESKSDETGSHNHN